MWFKECGDRKTVVKLLIYLITASRFKNIRDLALITEQLITHAIMTKLTTIPRTETAEHGVSNSARLYPQIFLDLNIPVASRKLSEFVERAIDYVDFSDKPWTVTVRLKWKQSQHYSVP